MVGLCYKVVVTRCLLQTPNQMVSSFKEEVCSALEGVPSVYTHSGRPGDESTTN